MTEPAAVAVEVVYIGPDAQAVIALETLAGSTVGDAIAQSGVLARHPEIDLQKNQVGIFARRVELTQLLQQGDRIEIYRPLLVDPKQARRAKGRRMPGG